MTIWKSLEREGASLPLLLVTAPATCHCFCYLSRRHAPLLLVTGNYPIHLVIKTCYDITHFVLLTSLFDSERLFTENGNHHHLQFIDINIIIRSVMLYRVIGGTGLVSFAVILPTAGWREYTCLAWSVADQPLPFLVRSYLHWILACLPGGWIVYKIFGLFHSGISSHSFQWWNLTHFLVKSVQQPLPL